MLYQYYHKDIKRTEMQIARTKPTFIFLKICISLYVLFCCTFKLPDVITSYAALCPPKSLKLTF